VAILRILSPEQDTDHQGEQGRWQVQVPGMFGADFVHRDKSFCICELGLGDFPEEKVNCQRWSWFDKEDWKIRPLCAFGRNKSLSPREVTA
jgi:hypothetical protein